MEYHEITRLTILQGLSLCKVVTAVVVVMKGAAGADLYWPGRAPVGEGPGRPPPGGVVEADIVGGRRVVLVLVGHERAVRALLSSLDRG